jgi:ankyrin repeat protein
MANPHLTDPQTQHETQGAITAPDLSTLPPAAIDLATTLFNCARQGDTNTLSYYLALGIPPNLTNGSGSTLLMLAAYHGHAATVRMLLTAGADPNALNDHGQSPLAGAVFKGYGEVVKVLVVEGLADVFTGIPNAVDTARMFRRVDLLAMMGVVNGVGESQGTVDGSGGVIHPPT